MIRLIELARDGSAAHRLARRANAFDRPTQGDDIEESLSFGSCRFRLLGHRWLDIAGKVTPGRLCRRDARGQNHPCARSLPACIACRDERNPERHLTAIASTRAGLRRPICPRIGGRGSTSMRRNRAIQLWARGLSFGLSIAALAGRVARKATRSNARATSVNAACRVVSDVARATSCHWLAFA
jgi:hypothetical protein